MSAATVLDPAVTPARVRRRGRQQQVRGPVARPQQLQAPAGRPVQPVTPRAGAPVQLRRPVARVARPVADTGGPVQLTDRGLALVLGLIAVLVMATMAVGVTRFLAVSNAPLEAGPSGAQVAAAPLDGAAGQ